MLREVYLVIIMLNIYHFDIYLCADCIDDNSAVMKLVCTIANFKRSIIDLVNTHVLLKLERARRRTKKGLIKLYDEMTNDDNDTDGLTSAKTTSTSTTQAPDLRRKDTKTVTGVGTAELITAHGYVAETHNIHTDDGYVLTVYRMLANPKHYLTENTSKGSVLLHHGLLGSSEDWLLLDTESTLPNMLLSVGYDVWLLNARGNKYTRVYQNKYRRSYTHRDFSWHEMGVYDLPATISYISNQTENNNLYYIGHSMGATALLVLLSTNPEYNNKLKSAIFLAPLAFMHHTKGPLKLFTEFPNATNDYLANGVFPADIKENFCQGSERSCANTLLFITNGGKHVWDNNVMENILQHVPAGGSTKIVAHYMQLIKSGGFRMFDYGPINNVEKYNLTFPPSYNLSAITVPISVFSSSGDWISTISDTISLINKLKIVKKMHIVRKDNFSHLDFIWSKDAPHLVFNVVMQILESSSSISNNDLYTNSELVVNALDDLVEDDD